MSHGIPTPILADKTSLHKYSDSWELSFCLFKIHIDSVSRVFLF